MLETLQRFFARPESRLDAQRLLNNLSPDGQAYAKHLVMSGPMANKTASKACGFTEERLEKAAGELEASLMSLRG